MNSATRSAEKVASVPLESSKARQYPSLFLRLVANTIEDDDGCWIWQGRTWRGYPVLSVRTEPRPATPKKFYAHRLMLEEVHGYYFPYDEAGHHCYKTACIRPDCLEVQTSAHNRAMRRNTLPDKPGKRWIPVLFPTPQRLLEEAIDDCIDNGIHHPAGEPCPF